MDVVDDVDVLACPSCDGPNLGAEGVIWGKCEYCGGTGVLFV